MPILLTCDCGKKIKVSDDKAGKRMKCPGCQKVLTVPAPETDDEPAPPRKSKKKNSSAPKKSSSGMLVLLLGLGAFLLLCTCGGGGASLWYFDVFGSGKKVVVNPKKDDVKTDKDKTAQTGVIEPRARFKAPSVSQMDLRALLLSPDGSRLTVNSNGKAQIWDIAGEPKKLRDFDGTIRAIYSDGKRVVVSTLKGQFLQNADSGAEIGKVRTSYQLRFGRDNELWSFGGPFKDARGKKKITLASINATTGKDIKELEIDDKGDRRIWPIDQKQEAAFVTESREVHFWDLANEKWVRQITLKPDAGSKILTETSPFAISPDGKWMLAPAGQGKFDPAVYDLSSGAAMQLPKTNMFPRSPAFVPNRDILMVNRSVGFKKDQVLAFDLKTNAVVATFGTVEGTVHTVAISSDGSTMAAGSSEGEVAIWDLKKGLN